MALQMFLARSVEEDGKRGRKGGASIGRNGGLMCDVGGCRTLIKTQDYLDVFARFKQKENIEAVERMLTSKTELELFERSQLGKITFFLSLRGGRTCANEADVLCLNRESMLRKRRGSKDADTESGEQDQRCGFAGTSRRYYEIEELRGVMIWWCVWVRNFGFYRAV